MSLLPTIGAIDQDTGFYNGVATQSLRFEDGSTSYLHRTPSASNRKTFVFSCWYKRANLSGVNQPLLRAGSSGSDFTMFYIDGGSDRLSFYDYDGSTDYGYSLDIVLRDTSAWYHLLCAIDTTQGTDTNRVQLYVNGTLVSASVGVDYGSFPQNYDTRINDNKQHNIGKYNANYIDGYMAEINFVDGLSFFSDTSGTANTSFNVNSFGETKNGVWIPIEYTGSYGTNGFHLEFKETGDGSSTASSSTIGADTSGNTHHFKDVNLDAYDSNMPDSPENNFPTWNPNAPDATYSITTITEGNLKSLNSAGSNLYSEMTFRLDKTNKYYFEYYNINATTPVKPASFELFASSTNKFSLYITNAGNIYVDGSSIGSSFPVLSAGDIVNIAFDGASGKIWLGHNGTYYNASGSATGNPADGSNPIATLTSAEFKMSSTFYQQGAIMNFGQDSTFAGNKTSGSENAQDSNGIGDFYDTVPSGFLALCSANLPEPTIGPNSGTNEQADDYFKPVIYSGLNNTAQDITVGLVPDWVWIKTRNASISHMLFDSVRGATKWLQIDAEGTETTGSDSLTDFDVSGGGFSLGADTSTTAVNNNGKTYVSYNWKLGGAPTATNSAGAGATPTADSVKIDGANLGSALAGSIPATKISASTVSGVSIVTYTGTGSAGTVAHGLGAVPKFYIVKCLDNSASSDHWYTYHGEIASNSEDWESYANLALQWYENGNYPWNETKPTDSVFSIKTIQDVNESGKKYVAYVFADVEGFSKHGSYTGNNSTNGTFVFTGFRPSFVLTKSKNAGNWYLNDTGRYTINPTGGHLYVDLPNAESGTAIDILSNGFKIRNADGSQNASGVLMVYIAFAESPFKYANAR